MAELPTIRLRVDDSDLRDLETRVAKLAATCAELQRQLQTTNPATWARITFKCACGREVQGVAPAQTEAITRVTSCTYCDRIYYYDFALKEG